MSSDMLLNNQAVLKPRQPAKPPTPEQLFLAANLAAAMDVPGAPTPGKIAEACGVTEQAVSGWKRTGKITKQNLAILADLLGRSVTELLTGIDPNAPRAPPPSFEDRHEVTESEWQLLQAVKIMMTDREKSDLLERYQSVHSQVEEQLGRFRS